MPVAKERIYRNPDGTLSPEHAASQFGATLAYIEGDDMADEDHKAFTSGKAVGAATKPPLMTATIVEGSAPVGEKSTASPGAIEVTNVIDAPAASSAVPRAKPGPKPKAK